MSMRNPEESQKESVSNQVADLLNRPFADVTMSLLGPMLIALVENKSVEFVRLKPLEGGRRVQLYLNVDHFDLFYLLKQPVGDLAHYYAGLASLHSKLKDVCDHIETALLFSR